MSAPYDYRRLEDITTGDWRQDDVLQELHQERGWTAADIARRFDEEQHDVLQELKDRGIYAGRQNPAKHGLARKLWEHGLTGETGGASQ